MSRTTTSSSHCTPTCATNASGIVTSPTERDSRNASISCRSRRRRGTVRLLGPISDWSMNLNALHASAELCRRNRMFQKKKRCDDLRPHRGILRRFAFFLPECLVLAIRTLVRLVRPLTVRSIQSLQRRLSEYREYRRIYSRLRFEGRSRGDASFNARMQLRLSHSQILQRNQSRNISGNNSSLPSLQSPRHRRGTQTVWHP